MSLLKPPPLKNPVYTTEPSHRAQSNRTLRAPLGVFRFWTFLKSSCFRSLYGALDLKNKYCAKKIRKFYLLAIAHGG